LRFGVSSALLAWLAWRTDWQQVGRTFAHLRLEFWLAAVGLYAVTQVVSAIRWRQLAEPLGFQRSLGRFVTYYFVGMFFNLLLPTSVGGDVVRAWYLDANSGRRLPAFLSVFIDRFSGLLVLLAMACIAAALCPIALPRWIPLSVWATAGGAVVALLTLPVLARWIHHVEPIERLLDGTRHYLTDIHLLWTTTALSIVVQAANVVLVWLVGVGIGAPVPASYYWIIVPMVTLLTLLPVSLNGMGVREGGMIVFLAPLSVDHAAALSLAFLWFSVMTATSLLGAVLYLFGERPKHEPIRRDPDQGRTGQSRNAA
jgi:uncharacterized membrane protein YbhN (UPF0104 family)